MPSKKNYIIYQQNPLISFYYGCPWQEHETSHAFTIFNSKLWLSCKVSIHNSQILGESFLVDMETIENMFLDMRGKSHNRDIREVRKRQHQDPEFGHTQGEIQKKPAKKYISIGGGGGETFLLSSFLITSTAVT
jgi:hypothetical protein